MNERKNLRGKNSIKISIFKLQRLLKPTQLAYWSALYNSVCVLVAVYREVFKNRLFSSKIAKMKWSRVSSYTDTLPFQKFHIALVQKQFGVVVKTPDSHPEIAGSNPVVADDNVNLNTKENMKNCL